MVVADASFCGAWFLPDERSNDADRLLESLIAGRDEMWVPALWFYELTNLFRSARRRDRLAGEQLSEALSILSEVPVTHVDVPDSVARERILKLSQEHALSAYDASYLELADRLQCPLLTADSVLQTAAHRMSLGTALD